jgi:hypothetical protein
MIPILLLGAIVAIAIAAQDKRAKDTMGDTPDMVLSPQEAKLERLVSSVGRSGNPNAMAALAIRIERKFPKTAKALVRRAIRLDQVKQQKRNRAIRRMIALSRLSRQMQGNEEEIETDGETETSGETIEGNSVPEGIESEKWDRFTDAISGENIISSHRIGKYGISYKRLVDLGMITRLQV